MDVIKSDDIIQQSLADKAKKLENKLDGELIFLRAPMAPGVDNFVRTEIANLSSMKCRDQLIVVLETNGGSIEVVERISDVFRHHFSRVVFVVPNQAYSAGTVLVLSGDAIYMDYYSVLGPIDPQIKNRDGRWVPGLGYLEKYNSLIEKSESGNITPVELEFLIRKFDPAELFALEQAKTHSEDLIEKWLSKYKFKNWKVKETSNEEVSDEERKARAKSIAQRLGDPTEWKSHSRGINLKTLESNQLKLKIDNFAENSNLNNAIREYYDLLIDYCSKLGAETVIHTKHRFLLLGE